MINRAKRITSLIKQGRHCLENHVVSLRFRPVVRNYKFVNDYKRIYHYHIRKSGGTSLNFAFFSLATKEMEKFYAQLDKNRQHCLLSKDKVFVGWNKQLIELGNYFFAFSHIPKPQLKLPPDSFTITILRDPVKRVISHYQMLHYYVHNQVKHSDVKTEGHWLGNGFSDFLKNIPKEHLLRQLYMFSPGFDVNEAEANIRDLNFYFTTDNFSIGLRTLGDILNFELKEFRKKTAKTKLDLTNIEKEELRTKLAPEIELYERLVKNQ